MLTVGVLGALGWALRPTPAAPRPPPPGLSAVEQTDLAQVQKAMGLVGALASGRLVPQRPDPSPPELRERVVEATRYYLSHRPQGFRADCSGFVSAVFTRAGVPMDGVVASIWDIAVANDLLHWRERPTPGDLVFFDDTWDRNGNGRMDDALSHIGVVLDVEPDGTIVYAQDGTSRGRSTARMNLYQPDQREDGDGRVLNEPLRAGSPFDPPDAPGLTGELWVGFAAVDPAVDWYTWEPWVPLD
ncbi:MAG: CHAP domain-containing protein [Alphaproteobacteria bacterium]|nr:CHAP domain-containing protein [Alphaproteobacteria bacterium]